MISIRRPVHSPAHEEVSQALPLQLWELQRAQGQDKLHPHGGLHQEQALGQHKVYEGISSEIDNKSSQIYVKSVSSFN